MEVVWVTAIVFAFLLVVFVVLVLRFPDEVPALLARLGSFEVSRQGVALRLYSGAVQDKEHRSAPRKELASQLNRIAGGRILWVDDIPENNRAEIQALRALGVEIDTATSNGEALRYAAAQAYDLILSDIGREPPQDPQAGLALVGLLREAEVDAPVVYYVGSATAPQTSTGEPVFDRPTALLQHIAAALSR